MKSLLSIEKLSSIMKYKSMALALAVGIAIGVAFDRVPSVASGLTSVDVPIKTQTNSSGPPDMQEQLDQLQKQMDELKSFRNGWPFHFDGFDSLLPPFDDPWLHHVRSPRMNTVESKDTVKVTAELPGLDEKDIEVIVSDRSVVIKGQRDQEKFMRSIYFSTPVKPEESKATLSKGVLTIELPKGTKVADSGHKLPIHTE